MKKLEAVIFDMDGVIFDSEKANIECWKVVSKKYNMPNLNSILLKCLGTTDQLTKQIFLDEYGKNFPYDKIEKEVSNLFNQKYNNRLPIKKGVLECLNFLYKNKIKMAVASSTKQSIVELQLKIAKLYKFFNIIIGGDFIKNSKPNPEIFIEVCNRLNVKPKNTYVIEDSYNGISAAFNGEMHPVMIPDLLPPNDEIKHKVDYIFDSLFDFIKFLKI